MSHALIDPEADHTVGKGARFCGNDPAINAGFARIVGSDRAPDVAVISVEKDAEVCCTAANIFSGIERIKNRKAFSGPRHELHKSFCTRMTDCIWVTRAFSRDDGEYQSRVQVIFLAFYTNSVLRFFLNT